jgi:hypothetical protein
MMRGENARKMQLSDLFTVELKESEGPTKCTAVIGALREGKMNTDGKLEYAGMLRHKNVLLCPVNALAMYFHYRWDV